jgi:hypothetical protein
MQLVPSGSSKSNAIAARFIGISFFETAHPGAVGIGWWVR